MSNELSATASTLRARVDELLELDMLSPQRICLLAEWQVEDIRAVAHRYRDILTEWTADATAIGARWSELDEARELWRHHGETVGWESLADHESESRESYEELVQEVYATREEWERAKAQVVRLTILAETTKQALKDAIEHELSILEGKDS